jgi:hypothetical protein
MTKADEYRRYAAECLALSQRHKNADNAKFLTMAEMRLRIAEAAEKSQGNLMTCKLIFQPGRAGCRFALV